MIAVIRKCLPTYEVVEKIGQGVFGVVFHVRDNLKERAVKVVPIMVERSLSYRTARDLDSKISHDFHAVQEYYHKIKGEGIIEIYDFHLVDKQVSAREARAYLVILMELCPANLLNHVIDNYPLSAHEAKHLMLDLAKALLRLSNRTEEIFIVKDLKPSNLLITSKGDLVIGDLGGVQRIDSMSATANAQFTPNWSAPELITHSEKAGIASLIFSYGFVSYFIWCGTLPYDRENFTTRLRLLKDKGVRFPRKDMPHEVREVISNCLKFKPADRPQSFLDVIRILEGESDLYPLEEKKLNKPSSSIRRTHKGSATPEHSTNMTEESGSGPKRKIRPAKETTKNKTINKVKTGRHRVGDTWIEPVSGMVFAWVPAGTFKMGCGPWDGEGNADEFPVHDVTIEGFWLGRYPVTQDQWKKLMEGSFWHKVRGHNPSWFKMGGDYPVEQVTWFEAKEFCEKLIAANKNRYHFRLPTEAEWEYASRSGGKEEKYPGGLPVDKVAWYSNNSKMTTHPVGQKEPNGLGLYDMSGNVYEWCEDIYNPKGYNLHEPENPLVTSGGNRRVIRGGSWCNFPGELRCCYRGNVKPDFKGNYLGFRVVMTPLSRRLKSG